MLRLFIAINFCDATRGALFALRGALRAKSASGSFSEPDNLHLTLVFIGECGANQAAAVKAVMDTVSFEPFNVVIDRVGRFRRPDGDIWWAGVRESEPLSRLQRELTAGLIAAGFNVDDRKYSPHITLGRKVLTDEREYALNPFGETAASIELMKSERVRGRLTYTAIYTKEGQR